MCSPPHQSPLVTASPQREACRGGACYLQAAASNRRAASMPPLQKRIVGAGFIPPSCSTLRTYQGSCRGDHWSPDDKQTRRATGGRHQCRPYRTQTPILRRGGIYPARVFRTGTSFFTSSVSRKRAGGTVLPPAVLAATPNISINPDRVKRGQSTGAGRSPARRRHPP